MMLVYTVIRKKKYSHPHAIHFIGRILACLIFEMMKHKNPFNSKLFRKLLKKYKIRNPEKLLDLLEKAPLISD